MMPRVLGALARMPETWIRALVGARVLLAGRWSQYMGFRPKNALNSFFYRTQWLNIERFGRSGVSPLLGLGSYPMSRWFHLSILSTYAYANAGAATALAGTLLWVLTHLVWLQYTSSAWALLVCVTLLFSATSYAMAFVRQNYNILGWLWLPIAFFGLLTGHPVLAMLSFFAASLGSFTAVVVSVPLVFALALAKGDVTGLWVLAPALAKLATHFVPLLTAGSVTSSTRLIGKAIGLIGTGAVYKRESIRLRRRSLYLAALYLGGCGAVWVLDGAAPILPLAAAAVFVVNQRFRFADDQSVVMLFVTAFAAHVLFASPGVLQWVVLFIIANPHPKALGLNLVDGRVEVYRPFDHSRVEHQCEELYRSVEPGERVLVAFNEPHGVYENLFDGYRVLLEPLQYVAARRGIHQFPDWYAVSETNFAGAPNVWGRGIRQVQENMKHWGARYVLFYHQSGTELASEWTDVYKVVARLDWAELLDDFGSVPPWAANLDCPTFTLLRSR